MKSHKSKVALSVLIGCLSLLPAGAEPQAEKELAEARTRFYDAKTKIESDYRASLAALLPSGDRIEIYLLDFETEEAQAGFAYWENSLEDGEFPIIPYNRKSKILKRATLTAGQVKAFLPKLQQVVGIQGEIDGGAFCHYPIHGVRVFSGKEIIFQTSLCWKCNNFAIQYPDASAWVGIRDTGLSQAFAELMPIPQSEEERFNAQFKKKESKPPTKVK